MKRPSEGPEVKEGDRALIAQIRQGDQTAFDTLVRRHQKDLYRLAYRMTRNADDAKDLSQEAFIRAYRGLASFDGRSSLSTWLYRITVNLCLTHLRHQSTSGEGKLPESYPDPSPKPLVVLEERELYRAVGEAVAGLPPQQQATLVLRVHHGLPYREIAEILESTEGTVRANYFHAVANLRSQLTDLRERT
ncbi:MAG: RNA polymerase sigma factor [Candidatus Methylomirabilales bacterium]